MQEEAVEYIASTVHKLQNKGDGKRRLFLIQTYVIGKEHILIEVKTFILSWRSIPFNVAKAHQEKLCLCRSSSDARRGSSCQRRRWASWSALICQVNLVSPFFAAEKS